MQHPRTISRKNTSIPLDRRSVAILNDTGHGLQARSYLNPMDGTGYSFQRLFDPHKSWAALREEMPHTVDFGLQFLQAGHIDFVIFWPGYDPRGITFKIELWRRNGSENGVRDYADLVLEIARCYDAFFRNKEPSFSAEWDIRGNRQFMVENLGLVEIRNARDNVFYADVEFQPNVRVPKAVTPPPSTTFPRSTVASVKNDKVFKLQARVSKEAEGHLRQYLARFPYPSDEQCSRLAALFPHHDVILIKMWFERYGKGAEVVSPSKRLKAALDARKAKSY